MDSFSKIENFFYIYKKLNMKISAFLKFSLLLIVGMWINNSMAQDAKIARIESEVMILKSKENGHFIFNVQGLKNEQVIKCASYYPLYFSTSYTEKTGELSIRMVQSDAQGRRVIIRFFSALDIQQIESEGKIYLVNDFYDKFLQ
jgi:hypothetical protein